MSERADRPRILVLTPDFPPAWGGIQQLTGNLVESLVRLDPLVVTSAPGPGSPSVRRVRVPAGLGRRGAIGVLNLAGLVEARALRPHAVLSMHVNAGPAALALRRFRGIPLVQYVHARELHARPWLSRWVLAGADAVIAVSSHARSLALAYGASAARLHVIPPGVHPQAQPQQLEPRPLVVSIARLDDEHKGHDVLLRAMVSVRERVPDATLVVAGDGRLRAAHERLASTLRLDGAVEFAGAIDEARKSALLAEAAVFALPSRAVPGGGSEGFGIAYLEAAAAGVPVVAGNAGGAVDAVADGETGLLVDPTDADAVADALVTVLRDSDLRARLGAAAAERAEIFAWPAVARRVEEVVLEAIESGR